MAGNRILGKIARRALAAQPDSRLVDLVRDGHESAFDEIVSRYRRPLVAFAVAMVGSNAEDVVQASLFKAYETLHADDREIELRPWLFTIVRNRALNSIRDEPVHTEIDPEYGAGLDPAQIAERNEEIRDLVTAICALPDDQREALVRRELAGVGHAEIAAQLGTSATAVRGLIFRAREGLRAAAGALIPLPLMSALLGSGSASAGVGAAAAGLGAGTGAIATAGVAKTGAAVVATAFVMASGVAITGERNPASSGGTGDTAAAADREAESAVEPVAAESLAPVADRDTAPLSDGSVKPGSTAESRTESASSVRDEGETVESGADVPDGSGETATTDTDSIEPAYEGSGPREGGDRPPPPDGDTTFDGGPRPAPPPPGDYDGELNQPPPPPPGGTDGDPLRDGTRLEGGHQRPIGETTFQDGP